MFGWCLQLDRILADRESAQLAEGLGRLEACLVGGQSLADGACLLGPQVERLVLFVLVELSQVLLLLLMHNNVDTGNGLPNHSDLGQL